MALTMSRLWVSRCLLNGVVEDRRFLRVVSAAITVSPRSFLTTFVKGSPARNGSNYVKTVGVLMPPKWGCRGQEVPEGGFPRNDSVPWVISNNFCKRVSSQKLL